jgi:hypothetical protein
MYQDIDRGYMFGYIQTDKTAMEYYRDHYANVAQRALAGFEASTDLGSQVIPGQQI